MGPRKTSPALLAVLLASLTLSSPAAGAPGFDIRWNACAVDAGVSNESFACDTDAGSHSLIASFRLDQPINNAFIVNAVFDFIVANDAVVPAWWEFFDCRFGALQPSATIYPGAANCADWAAGLGFAGLADFSREGTIDPADTASHRRFRTATFANPFQNPPQGVNLVANQEYFMLNVLIDNFNTTSGNVCAGCSLPVCIVLNSIDIMTTQSVTTTLTSPSAPGSNFATWQGGTGANCSRVPVKQATWGAVKALYR